MPRASEPEQLGEHAGPSKNVDNRSRVRRRRRNTGRQLTESSVLAGSRRGSTSTFILDRSIPQQISTQNPRQGNMLPPVASSNPEQAAPESASASTAASAAAATPRAAGPGAVRRHRLRGILQLVLGLAVCVDPTLGFRGPHHPKSSVSHHHYVPVKTVKLTQDEQLLHDASHLVEDMGALAEQIDVTKMNAQELEFYYFRLHDFDNNTKLDGLELLHALQHTRHGEDGAGHAERTNEINHEVVGQEDSIVDFALIVDRVLEEDDLDNDGYLGYIEYVLGKQKDQDERMKRDVKLKI